MTTLDSRPVVAPAPGLVDARGPRFGAAVTAVVYAVVLLTLPSTFAAALLALQLVAHGLGAVLGVKSQPYGVLFRKAVAPRLGRPTEFEDPAPPRFAQAVGFGFALVALASLLVGAVAVAYVAVALAFAAAFLNAAFTFCLGCEMYLLGKRVLGRRSA
jgi:hypothetical protein